jgi:DNA-binding NarL/FixJ family response regulator
MPSHTSKKGRAKVLSGRVVHIIGQHLFQNELIAFYLKREFGLQCSIGRDPLNIDTRILQRSDWPALILIECPEKDLDAFLRGLKKGDSSITARHLVALFNVEHGQGIEERAVARGIRGIFNSEDPINNLYKGIRAIFDGELWVSKEVLTKYMMEKRGKDVPAKKDKALLTSREIEILAMISLGNKNEAIAEKLFISQNTVKTHIYNIFKKIDVPNRLQASLWAAKNL